MGDSQNGALPRPGKLEFRVETTPLPPEESPDRLVMYKVFDPFHPFGTGLLLFGCELASKVRAVVERQILLLMDGPLSRTDKGEDAEEGTAEED